MLIPKQRVMSEYYYIVFHVRLVLIIQISIVFLSSSFQTNEKL